MKFARFRQADIQRALKAAQRCGYEDVRVMIAVDGQIEIIVGRSARDDSRPVELE